MILPTKGVTSSDTQIEVDWTAYASAPQNGGSTVTSYNLQWDSGTSGVTYTDIIGYSPASTALTYTISSGLTVG